MAVCCKRIKPSTANLNNNIYFTVAAPVAAPFAMHNVDYV
jgi:hypothetical protein